MDELFHLRIIILINDDIIIEIIIPSIIRFIIIAHRTMMVSAQVSGLQEYVRNHCRLAKLFEQKVLTDPRFQVRF